MKAEILGGALIFGDDMKWMSSSGGVDKPMISHTKSPWFSEALWIFHLLFHKLLITVWKKRSFTQVLGKNSVDFPENALR